MAYNLLIPYKIIDAVSMAASVTSSIAPIQEQDNIGVQLHWTGSPVGAFTIEVSMDHKQDSQGNVQVAGNWISLTLDPTITASGSGDDAYIDLNQLSAPYVRVVYTRTSGTGSLTAYITGKGV